MGTVTQYNLANVRDALGGGNPVYMSNYYRGGPYVPTTRTVTISEGPVYDIYNYDFTYSLSLSSAYWNSAGEAVATASGEVGSITFNGFTYIRGAYVQRTGSIFYAYHYQITRQYQSTISINTGVPSSGTIYISQLYGAENP